MKSKLKPNSLDRHAFTIVAAVLTVGGVIGGIHAQAAEGGTSSTSINSLYKSKEDRKSLSANLYTPGDGMTEFSITPSFASSKDNYDFGSGSREISTDTKALEFQIQNTIPGTDVSIRAGTVYGSMDVTTPGSDSLKKDGTGNFNLGASYRIPVTNGNVFVSFDGDFSPGNVDAADKHFYTGVDTYKPAVSYETMTTGGTIWGGGFAMGFPTVKTNASTESGHNFYSFSAFGEIPVTEYTLGLRGDLTATEAETGRLSLDTRVDEAALIAYAEFIVDKYIRFVPQLSFSSLHPNGLANSSNVTNSTSISVLMGMTL